MSRSPALFVACFGDHFKQLCAWKRGSQHLYEDRIPCHVQPHRTVREKRQELPATRAHLKSLSVLPFTFGSSNWEFKCRYTIQRQCPTSAPCKEAHAMAAFGRIMNGRPESEPTLGQAWPCWLRSYQCWHGTLAPKASCNRPDLVPKSGGGAHTGLET